MTNQAVDDPIIQQATAIAENLLPRVDARIEAQFPTLREQVVAQVIETLDQRGLLQTDRPPEEPKRAQTSIINLLKPEAYNPHAIGAQLDGRFSDFGDFMKAVFIKGSGGGRDERLMFISEKGDIRADLSGNELATGGALVPEEFRAQLLQIGLGQSRIRPLCMRIPMGSSTMRIPAVYDTAHNDNTVFGGVRGYWTAAGGSITESEPSFRQVGLEAKGLKFYTELENELIADAFLSASALVVQMIGQAEPWFFDQAAMNGSGVNEPLGVRNAAAKVSVTRGTSNEINIVDIANMYARQLMPDRAVWLVSQEGLAQLMQLESSGGAQVFWPDLTTGLRMRLGGQGVIVTEHCAQLGSADDIMFVDFGFYLVGDRQALSLATSPHFRFQNDITAVRGVERLDGQPWVQSAITPANGGDTLSPIVSLAA